MARIANCKFFLKVSLKVWIFCGLVSSFLTFDLLLGEFPRSINLKFILSKIFLDLCITSDKLRSSPPLTFTFTQRGPFHFAEKSRIKNRKVISDLSATATWSPRAKGLKYLANENVWRCCQCCSPCGEQVACPSSPGLGLRHRRRRTKSRLRKILKSHII